jgi:hypothetical protein
LITFAKQNPPADWRAPFSDLIKAALTGKRGGLGKVLAMAETKAAGLCQSGAFGVRGMKHQRHFGSASNVALREVARICQVNAAISRLTVEDCARER